MTEAATIIAESINNALTPGGIEYVSLFFSATGIIISGIAIWVAVMIPKKIAEQQNKIALFDRRFEFYTVLRRSIVFFNMIRYVKTKDKFKLHEVQFCFLAAFGDELVDISLKDKLLQDDTRLRWKVISVLEQGQFLFSFDTTQWIKPLIAAIASIGDAQKSVDYFQEFYKKFVDIVQCIDKELMPRIEHELQLSHISKDK